MLLKQVKALPHHAASQKVSLSFWTLHTLVYTSHMPKEEKSGKGNRNKKKCALDFIRHKVKMSSNESTIIIN